MSLSFEQRPGTPSEKRGERLQERLRDCFVILGDMDGRETGLRVGDVIYAVDGNPIVGDDLVERVKKHPSESAVFRVWRNGESLDVEIRPEFSKTLQRPAFGFLTRMGTYAFSEDGEPMGERLKGMWKNADGKDVCGYRVACDPYTDEYEIEGIVRTGHRITRFEITSPETGEVLNVMERCNSTDTPIFFADVPLEDAGGIHQASQDLIVVNEVRTPLSLFTILHELRHAEQVDDPKLEKIRPLYGLDIQFREQRGTLWNVELSPILEYSVERIVEAFPQECSGIDLAMLQKRIRQGDRTLMKKVWEARDEEQKKTELFSQCLETVSEWEDGLRQLVRKEPDVNDLVREEFWKELGFGIPAEEQLPFDHEFYPLLDFATVGTPEQFRELFQALFVNDENLHVLQMAYEPTTRILTAHVGFPWGQKMRSVQLSMTIPEDEGAYIANVNAQFVEQQKTYQERCEEVLRFQHDLLESDVKPGISLLDLLSLPRWVIERDAEAGVLKQLRMIRRETGIQLLTSYRREEPDLEEMLAQLHDETSEIHKVLTSEQLEILRARDMEYAKRETVTPQKNIRSHMQLIGATPQKMRQFRTPSNPFEAEAAE